MYIEPIWFGKVDEQLKVKIKGQGYESMNSEVRLARFFCIFIFMRVKKKRGSEKGSKAWENCELGIPFIPVFPWYRDLFAVESRYIIVVQCTEKNLLPRDKTRGRKKWREKKLSV